MIAGYVNPRKYGAIPTFKASVIPSHTIPVTRRIFTKMGLAFTRAKCSPSTITIQLKRIRCSEYLNSLKGKHSHVMIPICGFTTNIHTRSGSDAGVLFRS